MSRILPLGLLLLHALLLNGGVVWADGELAFFESKIRPVLIKHCYECHSADSDELGGKLRVDSRSGMLTGGESGPVLLAGRPDESLLVQAIRYDGLEMPPDGPLPETVINDFVKWISLGAVDPRSEDGASVKEAGRALASVEEPDSLWSFLPRQVPSIPEVSRSDWPRNSIDHFVLDRLEQAELAPTHDADAATLIRRLYYDLIGLPPTREQVDAFAKDHAKDARRSIERLVDSLLANPGFGVRWGRYWLDVARYGESNGDDGLGRNASFPHAWRYRDYVINAFNEDVPYDRFLTEQIAGDLLLAESAEERNRNLVATGFLAIGSKPASAMNNNFAMDVVDDQINVISTAVMGLSVACARCHDHKHDPIPTRDYYALAGIFASTETLYGAAGNEKLTAPPTPLHELRQNWSQAESPPDRTATPLFPETYSSVIDELEPLLHASFAVAPDRLSVEGMVSYSAETFAGLKETTIKGSLAESGDCYSVSFWFRNLIDNDARPITAYLFSRASLGDKALPGDHLGIGGNHESKNTGKLFVFNGNEKQQSVVGSTVIERNSWNHVTLVRDDHRVKVFLNGTLEIDGELSATFGDSLEYCLANRSDNFAPLDGNLGQVAFFARAISDDEAVRLHEASGQPRGVRTMPADDYAMGVRDHAAPSDCKIHINGEGNKLGPVVPRGFLTAYQTVSGEQASPQLNSAIGGIAIRGEQSGRMELAQWLTCPDHPQTARVLVNRVWLHLFGQGIVATPDDFGVYGARPTHPQLLDHLADRFVQNGWSIKRLIREIVRSRTYQLDSDCDGSLQEADPENIWMARHHRRRLDAESLRDSMLQASGLLDCSPGKGSAVERLDLLINWPPGESSDLHRESFHRSVYLCMLRHASPKELAAFDLPDGVEVAGQRGTTTLPTQALFLLNSDFVVEQSKALAQRIVDEPGLTERQRVTNVFAKVLHRWPGEEEVVRSVEYLNMIDDGLVEIVTDPDRRRRRTWASFCQALLMINEFRYVD